MAEEDQWSPIVQEWTVDTGYCCAGALANAEDGALYAAAPTTASTAESTVGWDLVYAADADRDIMQEDGSTKPMPICEAATLKEATNPPGRPKHGLWIGGNKYSVVQFDPEFESGDATFITAFANRPKKGVHLVSTGTTIVIGMYDEEQEQTSGNCKRVVLAFAEYMKSLGN